MNAKEPGEEGMSHHARGRFAGALFLLAFACCGTGSALAGSTAGKALMLLNSGIVGGWRSDTAT
jgi:hypothetical protein